MVPILHASASFTASVSRASDLPSGLSEVGFVVTPKNDEDELGWRVRRGGGPARESPGPVEEAPSHTECVKACKGVPKHLARVVQLD